MTNVAIVHHSGYGHTRALAEAVATGARAVPGTVVNLIPVAEADARGAELDAAAAIVFGSPTYMGGVSADFAKFKDWTSSRWMEGRWRNNSPPASPSRPRGTATSTTRSTSCSRSRFSMA